MKAAANIKTPKQYLASLPEEWRAALETIHEAITKAAPTLKPHICHGMIGYGPVHYKTKSECEGDWFVVGLANQKSYMSLYLCSCDESGYLAEQNKDRLGKVSVGKSCIRFRKLEDLNLKVAIQLVKQAARLANPSN